MQKLRGVFGMKKLTVLGMMVASCFMQAMEEKGHVLEKKGGSRRSRLGHYGSRHEKTIMKFDQALEYKCENPEMQAKLEALDVAENADRGMHNVIIMPGGIVGKQLALYKDNEGEWCIDGASGSIFEEDTRAFSLAKLGKMRKACYNESRQTTCFCKQGFSRRELQEEK
jgi:hypothetical protein